MKCPSCLSVMYGKNNPTNFNSSFSQLRLHCWNDQCPARLDPQTYQSHMMVWIRPNQKWECREYHLPFQYKGKKFALVGEPFQGFLGYPKPTLLGLIADKQTTIYEIVKPTYSYFTSHLWNVRIVKDEKGELLTAPFIPISTGDDMHQDAQRVFDRLIKLAVFA